MLTAYHRQHLTSICCLWQPVIMGVTCFRHVSSSVSDSVSSQCDRILRVCCVALRFELCCVVFLWFPVLFQGLLCWVALYCGSKSECDLFLQVVLWWCVRLYCVLLFLLIIMLCDSIPHDALQCFIQACGASFPRGCACSHFWLGCLVLLYFSGMCWRVTVKVVLCYFSVRVSVLWFIALPSVSSVCECLWPCVDVSGYMGMHLCGYTGHYIHEFVCLRVYIWGYICVKVYVGEWGLSTYLCVLNFESLFSYLSMKSSYMCVSEYPCMLVYLSRYSIQFVCACLNLRGLVRRLSEYVWIM